MSRLPETYEENIINRMVSGDIGYTVPWAMYADEDRLLWINSSYSISTRPSGTVQLRIERTRDGVRVDESTIGDHKYSVGKPHYVGEFIPLPVDLISHREEK